MTVEVLTPAKINLGLEVIHKRDDGFHDIATVFQTISIFDRLRISASPDASSVQIVNRIEQFEANLVSRSLDLACHRGVTDRAWRVELEKRIPVAAGLGGASADAAGTLLALSQVENAQVSELSAVALELGSDVPFLLRGGASLAHGRGEMLEPLPSLAASWIVLAAPSIELDRKTARLYGSLRPRDFSDGSRVDRVAHALRTRRSPDPADLANAFERPLVKLMPEVDLLRDAYLRAGAPFTALSGAGPTHYTIVTTLRDAVRIATTLARIRQFPMRVLVARPTGPAPLIREDKTIDSPKAL